jgi:hypothetical protein
MAMETRLLFFCSPPPLFPFYSSAPLASLIVWHPTRTVRPRVTVPPPPSVSRPNRLFLLPVTVSVPVCRVLGVIEPRVFAVPLGSAPVRLSCVRPVPFEFPVVYLPPS